MSNPVKSKLFRLALLENQAIQTFKRIDKVAKSIEITTTIEKTNELKYRLVTDLELLSNLKTQIFTLRNEISNSKTDKKIAVSSILEKLIPDNDDRVSDLFEKLDDTAARLLEKINEKKRELAFAQSRLEEIQEKFIAKKFNRKEYIQFLSNPETKKTFKKDAKFAANLKKFDQEVIAHSANVIHSMTREAFLKIPRSELLSPKSYDSPKDTPNLNNFISLFNRQTNAIKELILSYDNVEQRAAEIEKWIWTADYLLNELGDVSAFLAVYSAIDSAPIKRLKATFESISNAALETREKNAEKAINFIHSDIVMKELLSSNKAGIPAMSAMMSVFTLSIENNNNKAYDLAKTEKDSAKAANASKDITKAEKAMRFAIAKCNEGGKKCILAFDVLKERSANSEFTATKDATFENAVNKPIETTVDKTQFTRSLSLEPRNAVIAPAKTLALVEKQKHKAPTATTGTTLKHLQDKLVKRTTKFLKQFDKEWKDHANDDKTDNNTSVVKNINEFKKLKRRKAEIEAFNAAWKEYLPADKISKEQQDLFKQLQSRLEQTDAMLNTKDHIAIAISSISNDLQNIKNEIAKTEQKSVHKKHHVKSEKSILNTTQKKIEKLLKKVNKISDLKDYASFSKETSDAVENVKTEVTATLNNIKKMSEALQSQPKPEQKWQRCSSESTVLLATFAQRFLNSNRTHKAEEEQINPSAAQNNSILKQ